nr:Casein kinase II alpha subunit Cell cycle [Hymenolepis microstoma]CUU98902.1 Casein kinase II alpha subunit Cell cycle [Hymenolepis microstoma]
MVKLKACEISRRTNFTITLTKDDIPVAFSSVYESSSANKQKKSFLEKLDERYKVKDGLNHIKFHVHFPNQTENMEPSIHSRHFIIENELGQGSYGAVFKLKDIENSETFAVKCIKDMDLRLISHEIFILRKMQNSRNVIHFYGAVYIKPLHAACLVMEHVDSIELEDILDSLKLDDIKYYSYQLLIALDECHKRNIIHCDVKPDNILIDPIKRVLRLIDFGMAKSIDVNRSRKTDIGTLDFNAPELLLNYKRFDSSIDIWAFGCIFASAVYGRNRLFGGDTCTEVLQSITSILGSDKFFEYIDTYGIPMSPKKMTDYTKFPVQTWDSLITEENSNTATDEALDLIEQLLVFDHKQRLSAEEAMKHPFYAE